MIVLGPSGSIAFHRPDQERKVENRERNYGIHSRSPGKAPLAKRRSKKASRAIAGGIVESHDEIGSSC